MKDYNVQSLSAVLARLLTEGPPSNDWHPVEVNGWFRVLHLCLLAVLAGGPMVACLRRPARDPDGAERLEFGMVLCLALVVSPVSWTHYYLLLLAPAALWLGGRLPLPARPHWAVCVGLALVLLSPPVLDLSHSEGVARLFLSHYWAGGVLLLGTLTAARWRIGESRPALRILKPSSPANDGTTQECGLGRRPA
jgi:hypothetical protein